MAKTLALVFLSLAIFLDRAENASNGSLPDLRTSSLAPISDTLKSYLVDAIKVIKNNALHRDSVDWPGVEAQTFKIKSPLQHVLMKIVIRPSASFCKHWGIATVF